VHRPLDQSPSVTPCPGPSTGHSGLSLLDFWWPSPPSA